MRSLKFRLCVSAALCAAVLSAAAATSHVRTGASARPLARAAHVRQEIERALTTFDQLTLDPSLAAKQARTGGALTLETSRGTLTVELEPSDVRASNWRGVRMTASGESREIERAPAATYKGRVRGMDGAASARFTIEEGRIEGLIIARDGLYFVEPARNFSASAGRDEFLFYSERDVRAESFGECGVSLAERVGASASRLESDGDWQTRKGFAPPEVFAPRPEVELATEADFEYFQFFKNQNPTFTDAQASAAALAEITSIVNQVDGIYESQVGIEIRIVHSRVWEADTDPYTLTSASQALTQFRTAYNSSFAPGAPPQRDLTHMWTGKDFDGSTIGIAYLGTVCADPARSYGISQRFAPSPQKVALTAHELGHNFNAEHPNQQSPAPTDCANDPATATPTIMNSSIT
ncbi:MAG TPA: M12 family metallo-peptidase, partial [Pyrinomonadaceae bacterium]|nr:M12 family metallo-peptidase [Pyrinomonadaceae bacterium]